MLKNSITKQQYDALLLQAEGREDPVFFGEKFLGLNFYTFQKLWLWATTKTQKTRFKELCRKKRLTFGIYSLEEYVDIIYEPSNMKHIWCGNNQGGKTFITSVKHIWSLYYKIGKIASREILALDDYKTLNTSPHSDQSNKCFEYVQRILNGQLVWFCPDKKEMVSNIVHPAIRGFISSINNVEREIRFSNGSIFWSKSSGVDKGTARAGEQFALITFDEASQAIHLEDTISPLLSRLLRYGYSFDIISTPEVEKRSSHVYYYNLVKQGMSLENGWFALTGMSLNDNIYIDPEQKNKTMKMIETADPVKYNQIVYGDFVSTGRSMFSASAVRNMFDKNIYKINQSIPTRKYILSADWAMSEESGDKTWFIVIDYTDYLQDKYNIVYHEFHQGGEPYKLYAMCREIYYRFGGSQQCKFIMDSSSMGGHIIKRELIELNPIDFYYHHGKKDEMLVRIQQALTYKRNLQYIESEKKEVDLNKDFGKIKSYYIPKLEEQLINYHSEDKKLEQDGVMTLGQAIWWIEKLPKNKDMFLDLNPIRRYNNYR